MKITMRVSEGPEAGKEYVFPEVGDSGTDSTNILVGRDDVSCEAHWRLSREDPYVSRAHFVLEVRPPNLHLQDVNSMNGTFLRRAGRPETLVQNEILESGDRLRVGGRTVLGFEIEAEKPVGTIRFEGPAGTQSFQGGVTGPGGPLDLICVRCGEPLERLPSLAGSLRDIDFMCDRCRSEVAAELRQEAEERAELQYSCLNCDADVTRQANRDGRAAELSEVALYYCGDCRQEAVRENEHRALGLPKGDFGGHTLIRSLGKGGMGEVFLACHPKTGRVAAVKLLRPIAKSDEKLLHRFHREISIMQRIIHPNLVRLYEAGQAGDEPFFISEFAPGGDLSQFIDADGRPTLAPKEAARLLADSLVGLAYFHQGENGKKDLRVHRDLKPENVLLWRKNGALIPKVADFGLAKSYEDSGGTTTKTGEFAGTWMYMPPEQITHFKYCTPVVDIYAMGVTLYYLLSGRSPLPDFPAPWEIEKDPGGIRLSKTPAQMVLHDPRLPLAKRRAGLPGALCRVADKAISKPAEDRYQSAVEFREAILQAL